ncbi:Adaptor protein complex AP-3 delta subunit [Piedraia hortae CBS 480.64]|uniref:AP-3 complex subunit delta n=1 Tax=Piedraia hortae CBS 480.64 TaxID=1314780 RepID=A0A6A7C8U1_9PEZI|nr:Adaptor protein complex AP-3 delta subunit [Piedraia hortae CBS 480.64]
MFEKDIERLIRGLRSHKGHEAEYMQSSLRECRTEIRSQDMDVKATALLKLVYLEMYGHDMSWASFHVLEVMSSAKYRHKRVGYLAAVQTFRPDTEVLMLVENLLKKDLNSPDRVTMSLPLTATPHVLIPSMAHSLLTDLLPKLSHSSPNVRKKAVAALYRLALTCPETLRLSWPKIKEQLMDENEDPSVTAAVINVICELGWRRPQDFLALAPRFFELLKLGKNNWMAIKIVKLFSVLIPLEPRLVKKLIPPLTNLIRETTAMSLMYECIHGIIQGGVLDAAEGSVEGDQVARLCTGKLRTMIASENDRNLRYVALLTMARVTATHPDLVANQHDVILECIDDADVSIRMRALDLVVGMISSGNLVTVVDRLLRQLRTQPPTEDRKTNQSSVSEDEDEESPIKATANPLPDDYRTAVIERILAMCSRDNYAQLTDFEWYLEVLVELVRHCPATGSDVAAKIGAELLNIAIRVKALRPEAAAAAQSLILEQRDGRARGVLPAAAFVSGEFASMLPDAEAVLNSLVHPSIHDYPSDILASYVRAAPKIFSALTKTPKSWTSESQSSITLLCARIHRDLSVQECSVEYLELMRLASEAATNQPVGGETPLLLTQAIPTLFTGMELNPVAPTALKQVPPPTEIDLDEPINTDLPFLLQSADINEDTDPETDNDGIFSFYHDRTQTNLSLTASQSLDQQAATAAFPTLEERNRLRAQRRERNRDDPFYIDPDASPVNQGNDVDSIPIIDLPREAKSEAKIPSSKLKRPKKIFEVLADETLDKTLSGTAPPSRTTSAPTSKKPKGLLGVDSSGLSSLSLDEDVLPVRRDEYVVEDDLQKAVREVEKTRLMMQREREMIGSLDEEGTVVKRKVRRKKRDDLTGNEGDGNEGGVGRNKKNKKKKKKIKDGEVEEEEGDGEGEGKRKKKSRRRRVVFDE